MSTNLLVECTREQQIEIENICVTKNCSISQYLINLHEKAKNKISLENKEFDPETQLEEIQQEVKKRGRRKKILDIED